MQLLLLISLMLCQHLLKRINWYDNVNEMCVVVCRQRKLTDNTPKVIYQSHHDYAINANNLTPSSSVVVEHEWW